LTCCAPSFDAQFNSIRVKAAVQGDGCSPYYKQGVASPGKMQSGRTSAPFMAKLDADLLKISQIERLQNCSGTLHCGLKPTAGGGVESLMVIASIKKVCQKKVGAHARTVLGRHTRTASSLTRQYI